MRVGTSAFNRDRAATFLVHVFPNLTAGKAYDCVDWIAPGGKWSGTGLFAGAYGTLRFSHYDNGNENCPMYTREELA